MGMLLYLLFTLTISDVKPIQMSMLTSAVQLIKCDLTKEQYEETSRTSRAHKAKIYPPYRELKRWMYANCVPHNAEGDEIRFVSNGEVIIDLQAIFFHHIEKLLTPEIIQKMLELKAQGAVFKLFFKYGTYFL